MGFPFLQKLRQRLLAGDDQQGNHKEHHQGDGRGQGISCHEQDDHQHHRAVEHQAGHTVGIKQRLPVFLRPDGVDDGKDHRQQDQSHTDGDGDHEHRIQPSDKRQVRHGLRRPKPQGREHIFKAEQASIEEPEQGGKNAAAGKDGRQVRLFETVQQESSQSQAQALSHISEHGSEDDGIGERHKQRGVKFIVVRQSVHAHEHLEGADQRRIFQSGGRNGRPPVRILLQRHEKLRIRFQLLSEPDRVLFRHPAAEDEKGFILRPGESREPADVKAGGLPFDHRSRRKEPVRVLLQAGRQIVVQLSDLPFQRFDLLFQGTAGLVHRPRIGVLNIDPFKMHGRVDRVRLFRFRNGHEIDAPYIGLVHPALFKDGAVVLLQIFLQLLIIAHRQSSEAESYIFKMQDPGKLKMQLQIGTHRFQKPLLLLQLRLQPRLLSFGFFHELVRPSDGLHRRFGRKVLRSLSSGRSPLCSGPSRGSCLFLRSACPGPSFHDRRGLLRSADPFPVGIAL